MYPHAKLLCRRHLIYSLAPLLPKYEECIIVKAADFHARSLAVGGQRSASGESPLSMPHHLAPRIFKRK